MSSVGRGGKNEGEEEEEEETASYCFYSPKHKEILWGFGPDHVLPTASD